ncbi:hypothetical protein BSKO_13269 [Bryopsis sp. KO-2023]|nr:hypothetical protein BSKO_13269 [Bryopsis sp. KO-2023]
MKTLAATKPIQEPELGLLTAEMLHTLSSTEPPQGHFQGMNGSPLMGDTLPLDIYEQYLETLGGLLGYQLPGHGFPYLSDASKNTPCEADKKEPLPAPDSPQFVDSIKQMLINQQESIVNLLKTQLKVGKKLNLLSVWNGRSISLLTAATAKHSRAELRNK